MNIETQNRFFKYFYKYRPLLIPNPNDPKSNIIDEHTLGLLEHGELYFSKPSKFNDPFDCRIEYDSNISLEIFEKILAKSKLSEKQKYEYIEKFKQNPQEIISQLNESFQFDHLNIFCLTKDEKNILMWSHYAQNHTGICIGFKAYLFHGSYIIKTKEIYTNDDYTNPDNFNDNKYIILTRIKYRNNMPSKYKIAQDDYDALVKFTTHKAPQWGYEQEYRVIIPNKFLRERIKRKQIICVEKTEIGEILFGIKTPDHIKEKIIDIIKTYPDPKPNVYQCVSIKGQYAISKEKIEI